MSEKFEVAMPELMRAGKRTAWNHEGAQVKNLSLFFLSTRRNERISGRRLATKNSWKTWTLSWYLIIMSLVLVLKILWEFFLTGIEFSLTTRDMLDFLLRDDFRSNGLNLRITSCPEFVRLITPPLWSLTETAGHQNFRQFRQVMICRGPELDRMSSAILSTGLVAAFC